MQSKNEEDFGVVGGLLEPYRFESVAPEGYEERTDNEDGLIRSYWRPDLTMR